MKLLFTLLFMGIGLVLPLASCSPFDVLNTLNDTSSVTVQHDIAYAAPPPEEGPRHALDIYTPAKALPGHPVVVFIYGGAWQGGTRQDYAFVGEALAARGLTVVIPDYRVYPPTIFPGFVDDAAAAVAWTKANIQAYGGNPQAMFIAGHSAGAHIAALVALDPEYLAKYKLTPKDLAGGIGLAGPYDFLPITRRDIKPIFDVPDQAKTQPITYAVGGNPPMLLLAGQDDTTVEPRNTIALDQAIAAHGGSVEMKLYPGIGHIGIILTLVPQLPFGGADQPVLNDMLDFIAAHMQQKG